MPSSWPVAAHELARAVTRRERLGALLTSCGAGTLTGTVAALVLARFSQTPPAWLAVASGALLGLAHGVWRARRVTPADPGDAAWALDRLGEANEAGLASALGGTEQSPAPPPSTRLKPVAGLPLALGAALAAGLALGLDARADGPSEAAAGEPTEAVAPAGPGSGDERTTESRERHAAEAARVRLALGLTSEAPPSAALLAERLQDPAAREAAQRALHGTSEAESALARALAAGPEAAVLLAQGLAQATSDGAALEAERRAALAAAAAAAPVVGASRRALVERYAALRRAQGGR